MKTSLIILLVVFLLVGCSSKENSAYVATVTSLSDEAIANLEEQNQLLLDENSALEERVAELESDLESKDAELVVLEDLPEQITLLENENTEIQSRVDALQDILVREDGDIVGEFVFCGFAFGTDFAYIDKVSMRKELEEYEAQISGVNPSSITSTHQMIWTNSDDGIIKIYAGGYMYPYIVRFNDEDDWMQSSVYSLTSGCYVDFPAMEQAYLDAIGE